MNTLDLQYQNLLQDILDNGITKSDRTGVGTKSVFGRTIRHKMSDGFPLLTTKKMYWKGIVTELLWFLRGDTNIKYLIDNDCHIWDGDAYKKYTNFARGNHGKEYNSLYHINLFGDPGVTHEMHGSLRMFNKEEFIEKIKTDSEFAKKWGDLGPVYGKQWRQWQSYMEYEHDGQTEFGSLWHDQILELVHSLKTNPDSRRLMVNAWNVGEINKMVLPPCHYGFQCWTRELTLEERNEYYTSNYLGLDEPKENLDKMNMPKRAISLLWNQRSVDSFLGLPFNIASYGLLLEILAKECNMIPDELIGNLGDTHIYLNHLDQVKEQIERELTLQERVDYAATSPMFDPGDFGVGDQVTDEHCHSICDSYYAPRTTRRESYELPTLTFSPLGQAYFEHKIKDFDTFIRECTPDQFIIENYKFHPPIKATLNN